MITPLDGVRIVGFTHIGAGPYALSLLGDMGADVVNVEPLAGDSLRARDDTYPGSDSAYFLAINRSKRAIALDLKSDRGREAALRVLRTADAVVENYRVGALDRLGLGYEQVKAVKPDIVYCSLSPWGGSGPMRDKPGMDLLAQAYGGIMGLNGEAGRPPYRVPPPIADFIGSYLACFAVMLGLRARDHHGIGQHIDVSLLGGQVATMANFITYFWKTGRPSQPVGVAHPQLVPYQPFRTADGYIIVTCLTERMWQSLCAALGRPDLASDPRFATNVDRVRNRDELVPVLEDELRRHPAAYWLPRLEKAGVPAGRINALADLYRDPQVLANAYIADIEHPVAGLVKVPGLPIQLGETPGAFHRPAPLLGEHTGEVLSEVGFAEAEIEELYRLGIAAPASGDGVVPPDAGREQPQEARP